MKRALAIAIVAACRSSEPPAPQPVAATSPEQLVALSCTACHGADLLAQQRITAKQWEADVKKMVGWGALVETNDQPALVAYLASRYDGSAAPFTVAEANEDALAAVEPTDDGVFAGGAADRGHELYLHLCAACHAPDGRGNAIGTNLVDRYLLFRAADFATVVRSGRGRMAAQPLSDPQLADLLAFLRTLGSA